MDLWEKFESANAEWSNEKTLFLEKYQNDLNEKQNEIAKLEETIANLQSQSESEANKYEASLTVDRFDTFDTLLKWVSFFLFSGAFEPIGRSI